MGSRSSCVYSHSSCSNILRIVPCIIKELILSVSFGYLNPNDVLVSVVGISSDTFDSGSDTISIGVGSGYAICVVIGADTATDDCDCDLA